MPVDGTDDQIAAVRAFNRFYTRKLGVLDQHLGKSPFSLSEARVLYELAHRDDLAAKEIGNELGLDAGYLSRIVQSFDEQGLITRKPLPADRRQYQLSLTAKGRQTFAKLNLSSQNEVAAMLARLSASDTSRLTQAMATIETVLEQRRNQPASVVLRSHRVGDMGWVISSKAPPMPRTTTGTSATRRWSPRSAHSSSRTTTPRASIAGSRKSAASRSARSFWSRPRTRSQNSACCRLRRKHADSVSAARWSSNASRARAREAIAA